MTKNNSKSFTLAEIFSQACRLTRHIKQLGSQAAKQLSLCVDFPSPQRGEGRISKRGTSFRNSGEGDNPQVQNDITVRSTEKNLVTSKKAFQVSVILNLFQDLDETLKHRGQFDVQGDVRRKLGKLCAFTLAEVLITLGVIGVVAAVTMPVLISNHRRSVTEARLAKFYSSMNQAVKRAELDYGDKSTWDKFTLSYEKDENGHNDISKPIPNTDYFNKYFKPYIVTTKIDYAANGEVLAYFPDGSMAGFSANSIHFYPNTKDYKASEFDTDSGKFKNDMENSGIKVFTFSTAASSGIEPYKSNWDGTKEMLLNDNNIGCKKEVTNERAYCTALIQMNGWKIPKDYPLRF